MSELQDPNKYRVLRPGMRIHLVGIGGTGLSAVAAVLLGQGYVVSGSDRQLNELTNSLKSSGATVFEGHNGDQAKGADMLLVSSAIPATNPEIQAAEQAGIPILKRDEFLGLLMADSYGIAIAGSHGKTTTTGMIAQIMIEGGLDPSVVVGAVLPALQSNGRAGKSEFFVVEADEYDYMFLGLRPTLAIVVNVEYDHPDLFPSVSAYRQAFTDFVLKIHNEGLLLACIDDEGAAALADFATTLPIRVSTYGLDRGEWQAVEVRPNQLGGSDFLVQHEGQTMGLIRLRVPGEHNVRNALAAVATVSELGIGFDTVRRALASFGGLGRRFQLIGEVGDVTIVDDYAHHPTEIRATLDAARQRFPGRRLWAVWQPHTFSRTRAMLSEFASCFEQADRVVALDVYQSRESDTLGIDTAQVVARMQGARASHVGDIVEAANYIFVRVLPGDVVLTLGAGDGNQVGNILKLELERQLAQQLGQRQRGENGPGRAD
ncbi:MAG TPA: UDP-N-acetylmuramate--L-alanine ligase [Anaerolineae bacterium]|nr:UDP-N-acetylmuramate--L-alanine ligase [Anaerolineae bacterium]